MLSSDRSNHSFGHLLAAEIRNVGLAVRREALLASIALAATCLLLATTSIRYREPLTLIPELMHPSVLVAILLPWIVWKGDPPFRRAYLWTLPVARQQAAVAKIAAGAIWLVVAMIVGFSMLAAMALATGGDIGLSELRLVGIEADLGAAARVPWSTPLWTWAVPVAGALTAYVASSALVLGVRHPFRLVGAVALAVALLVILAVNLGPYNALEHVLSRFLDSAIEGRFGLDFAFTGGVTSLSRDLHIPGPGPREIWAALPSAGEWAGAIFAWFTGALLALALALRRHWEP